MLFALRASVVAGACVAAASYDHLRELAELLQQSEDHRGLYRMISVEILAVCNVCSVYQTIPECQLQHAHSFVVGTPLP